MLNKIKTLFKKEEKFSTVCSSFIVSHIKDIKSKKTPTPEGLSPKEWELILNKILHAFDRIKSSNLLRSKGRQKVMNEQIKEGFDLFRKYFKEL